MTQLAFFVPFANFSSYSLFVDVSWAGQIWHCLDRLFKGAGIKANLSHLQPTVHLLTQIILPRYGDTLFQLVVFVEASEVCGGQCKASSKRPLYRWLELEEITAVSSELCGPEPFLYLIGAQEPMRCQELSIESELKSSSKKWTLVASTGYTEADLANLFSEFLQHSFPSRFLNQALFIDYLKRSQVGHGYHNCYPLLSPKTCCLFSRYPYMCSPRCTTRRVFSLLFVSATVHTQPSETLFSPLLDLSAGANMVESGVNCAQDAFFVSTVQLALLK